MQSAAVACMLEHLPGTRLKKGYVALAATVENLSAS
jgi:hypothetical protein